MQVLNFYSTIFADQLKRGRKTATIRLGDKSHKYRKNQAVLVTIGYQHSPREKIFEAVIDQVEVKRVKDLSPRDIEHDNPEFRRQEEMIHFLEQLRGVDDHPVTDDRGHPRLQDAGRQEGELEGAVAPDDGVAGVVAAVVADDEVVVVGQQVNEFPLGLVPPLKSDHTRAAHAAPHEKSPGGSPG